MSMYKGSVELHRARECTKVRIERGSVQRECRTA